jgi:hypothetical protein
MPTVKETLKELSQYDPDDELLVIYWEKSLCREWVEDTLTDLQDEYELTDEEVEQLVTKAWSDVTNQTYETGEIGGLIQENLNEFIHDYLKQLEHDKTKQLDEQLWEA